MHLGLLNDNFERKYCVLTCNIKLLSESRYYLKKFNKTEDGTNCNI